MVLLPPPTFPQDTHLTPVRTLIRTGDLEQALHHLTKLTKTLKPSRSTTERRTLAKAHYLLAKIYHIIQKPKKFQHHIQQALKICPHIPINHQDLETLRKLNRYKLKKERSKHS